MSLTWSDPEDTRKRRPEPSAPLPLFDVAAPFVAGSETSEQAAKHIEPDSRTLRGLVLAFLRGRGTAGATDEEIQRELGMNPNTQRPRRIELVEAHLVADSTQRRATTSGRMAVVWIAERTTA